MELTEGEGPRPGAEALPAPALEIVAEGSTLTIRLDGWKMAEPAGDDADNLIDLTVSLAGPEQPETRAGSVVHARALPDIVRWFVASAAGDWTAGEWRLGAGGFSLGRGIQGGRTVLNASLGDTPGDPSTVTLPVDADAMTRAAGVVETWANRFRPRWTPEGMALPAVSELERKQSRFLWRTNRLEFIRQDEVLEARLHFDDQFIILWTVVGWPTIGALFWFVLGSGAETVRPLAVVAVAFLGIRWCLEIVSLLAAILTRTRVVVEHNVLSREIRLGPFVRVRRFDLVQAYRIVVVPAWPAGRFRFLSARANVTLVEPVGIHRVLRAIDVRDAQALVAAITGVAPELSPTAAALRQDERAEEREHARAKADREDRRTRWLLVALLGVLTLAFLAVTFMLFAEDRGLALVSAGLTLGFVGLIAFVAPKRRRP